MSHHSIVVGDTVRVRDSLQNTFRNMFGAEALKARKVIGQDEVQGKMRFHLDGIPTYLWRGQCRWIPQKVAKLQGTAP